MCTHGDGAPGGYAEALAMLASRLDYLGAVAAGEEIADAELGEVLLALESAGARQAAVRSSVLARFDAAGCHDSDAYQNSSSWLRDRAGMTRPAAKRQLRTARILRSRPQLAEAMRDGMLSESWLEQITAWTRPVPDEMLDFTDEMILKVLAAGGDLDDAATVIAKILESARAQDQPDPGRDEPGTGDDGGFEDRSLRLETTLDGAGVLRGNLTPEAAAAVQAILESLGKKKGKEDTRSQEQRHHDALADAADRLLGSGLLPARAGCSTRAEVRIAFADLAGMPGGQTLIEAWLTGQTSEPGWLTGKDAEVAACDAMISPVVTATPDWDVAAELICLVAGVLGQHAGAAPFPAGGENPADRPPVPLPSEEWQALLYAVGKLAVKFVSGPGSIASLLRTGLLAAQFTGKSVPLDIGFSRHIPDSIRRAVIARAGGHCEWPGGCDVPAAASDVHHIVHKKDGGPTSASGCLVLCSFHHDVCIHRWNWSIDLQADGAVTAISPDGTQVLRGHPNRGQRPADGRPPPGRAA